MIMYAFFPSGVMLVCSIIIILKVFSSNTRLSNHRTQNTNRRVSKHTQITSILLTTNFLFFSLVSPLVIMNAIKMIQENTISTTVIYFLSYANHG
jgi:hypothetical protein